MYSTLVVCIIYELIVLYIYIYIYIMYSTVVSVTSLYNNIRVIYS